jgi:hypothetical protein
MQKTWRHIVGGDNELSRASLRAEHRHTRTDACNWLHVLNGIVQAAPCLEVLAGGGVRRPGPALPAALRLDRLRPVAVEVNGRLRACCTRALPDVCLAGQCNQPMCAHPRFWWTSRRTGLPGSWRPGICASPGAGPVRRPWTLRGCRQTVMAVAPRAMSRPLPPPPPPSAGWS